jgi:tRNA1(Val) A37 N6-methylase TrmN6
VPDADATPLGPLTDDAILGGRLHLLQPRRGHRAGTDAVLVAAVVPAEAGERVADFGAGVGTAGLAVLARVPGSHATLVEIDPALAAVAAENAARNGFRARARVVVADVATLGRPDTVLGPGSVDHVVANPPFNPPGGRTPEDPRTERARVAPDGLFAAWIGAAARVLTGRGSLALIVRPADLPPILAAMTTGWRGITLRFVHPRVDADAVRLILTARRGRRAAPRVLPPLVLHGDDGRFTPEAAALHVPPPEDG